MSEVLYKKGPRRAPLPHPLCEDIEKALSMYPGSAHQMLNMPAP